MKSSYIEFPTDITVWILGESNKHLNKISNSLNDYGFSVNRIQFLLIKKVIPKTNNSFFSAVNNPKNIEEVVLFLSIGNDKSVDGLLRKLPHYGKYSYLAFEGDEPTNIEKGQWPVLNSPLMKNLSPEAERSRTRF